MKENIEIVKRYYEKNAEGEWQRLEAHPFEFIFSTYMMDRYIKPGDTILDIGGGPGRYAIHYAKKGCDVTLVDLADKNIEIAKNRAKDEGVSLNTFVANCLDLDSLGLEQFDHVFLMGPMYHLLLEEDRVKAVQLALNHLKPGGIIYVSFILAFAGIIYDLKNPGLIETDYENPFAKQLIEMIKTQGNYEGDAFTKACFYHQKNILPFMEQFPLQKLHFFGQEGIFSPNEDSILQRDESEIATWIEIGKGFLELEELLSYSEHAMYIGKKK
ncbi:MAG: class I SAM-dependent methyltransferase [Bacilli bacterium]|jgi:S-adenosylmethionine-dependent methyltransferase|nr:class I SAM-dependent methyltransferase [Bacilli bacterium]HHU24933.1 class I SAM-dependent methyltransferase [Acholeplasmataceae bacterium]